MTLIGHLFSAYITDPHPLLCLSLIGRFPLPGAHELEQMQLILDTVPVLREEDRQDLLQVTPQWLLLVMRLQVDGLNMEQGVIVMFCLRHKKRKMLLQIRSNVHTILTNKAPACVLCQLESAS